MFNINRSFSFCLLKKMFYYYNIYTTTYHYYKGAEYNLSEEYFNKLLITSTLRYTLE